MSHGIYLKCDLCAATLGGEQVTANPEPPLGMLQGDELRRRARLRGWIVFATPLRAQRPGNREVSDACPNCAIAAMSGATNAPTGFRAAPLKESP